MKKYLVSVKRENASSYVIKHDGLYEDLGYVVAKSMKAAAEKAQSILGIELSKVYISNLSEADEVFMKELN